MTAHARGGISPTLLPQEVLIGSVEVLLIKRLRLRSRSLLLVEPCEVSLSLHLTDISQRLR